MYLFEIRWINLLSQWELSLEYRQLDPGKEMSFSSNHMSQLTFAIRMIIRISTISSRQRRSFHEIKSDEEANTLKKNDYWNIDDCIWKNQKISFDLSQLNQLTFLMRMIIETLMIRSRKRKRFCLDKIKWSNLFFRWKSSLKYQAFYLKKLISSK